jgi:hypothetical protein
MASEIITKDTHVDQLASLPLNYCAPLFFLLACLLACLLVPSRVAARHTRLRSQGLSSSGLVVHHLCTHKIKIKKDQPTPPPHITPSTPRARTPPQRGLSAPVTPLHPPLAPHAARLRRRWTQRVAALQRRGGRGWAAVGWVIRGAAAAGASGGRRAAAGGVALPPVVGGGGEGDG